MGGGCEAAVTVKRCSWAMFRECGELQYGKKFPVKLDRTVCKSYESPAIMHGRETWRLDENEMGFFPST